VGNCGYKDVRVPSWDARVIDRATAAESVDFWDTFKGGTAWNWIEVTEVSFYLQGQLVTVRPACDASLRRL
jgi:hypothetical protein